MIGCFWLFLGGGCYVLGLFVCEEERERDKESDRDRESGETEYIYISSSFLPAKA